MTIEEQVYYENADTSMERNNDQEFQDIFDRCERDGAPFYDDQFPA